MKLEFSIWANGCQPIKRKSFIFKLGPLHYRVNYHCGEFDGKKFACVDLILESVDPEPIDPSIDYDRLMDMEFSNHRVKANYIGYGVVKGPAYAFKTLANLAAILREIIKEENPDEFRCLFRDPKHASCWTKFFHYIARPTSAIREITRGLSPFYPGGEEWVISLNK